MSVRPYSATVLALGGMILMTLGLYFVFLRSPLLPEDPHLMGTSLAEVHSIGGNRSVSLSSSAM